MTHLVCWAVPVRGGYVLRADRSVGLSLQAARARGPQAQARHVSLVHAGAPGFSADRARRPAAQAIEFGRLTGGQAPSVPVPRPLERLLGLWLRFGLGAALLAVSGGHWIPALAGAWLIAGRPWLAAALRLRRPPDRRPTVPPSSPTITAATHAVLTRAAAIMARASDARVAHARAEALTRAAGLDDAAAVYAALGAGGTLLTIPPDVGIGIPTPALHETMPITPAAEPEPETPPDAVDSTAADLAGTPGILLR